MGAFRGVDSIVSAHGAVVVTPSDSTVINTTRGLYVGTSGDIAVRMADGMSLTFPSVPVGVFPIQVDQVKLTGTTASNIIALY